MLDPSTTVSRKKQADSPATDVEKQALIDSNLEHTKDENSKDEKVIALGITAMGLKVLLLLSFQNAFKNILMRVVMKDHPGFLLSTAIIIVEALKLLFSTIYIVLIQRRSPMSIISYMRQDWKNAVLLTVPATVYSLQMSLEYIALGNIDPASFSVLVQMKMLTTAFFFRVLLRRKLIKKQFMSLVILTVGVMLCNLKTGDEDNNEDKTMNKFKGVCATLGEFTLTQAYSCSSHISSTFIYRNITHLFPNFKTSTK